MPATALDINLFLKDKKSVCDNIKKTMLYLHDLKKIKKGEISLATKLLVEWKKEGYTALDFQKVIDWKHKEWIVIHNDSSKDMRIYFRPQTLFSKRNFLKYLSEIKDSEQLQSTNTQKTIRKPTPTINRNPSYDEAYIEEQRQKWKKYRTEGYHNTKP